MMVMEKRSLAIGE